MTLIERVQKIADRLTGTEGRLVAELMQSPREIALGTSAEFAARIGAHEATTSRLARKLGFDSYADFRDHLRAEFLTNGSPSDRVAQTLSGAQEKGFLPLLIAEEIAALTRLGDYVQDRQIAAAVQLLNRPRVFLFARGNAEALAVLMDRRLRRMGVATVLLRGDARDLAEQMLTLGKDDAVLLFAFRRQPRDYARIIALAQQRGAATLAISGSLGPALAPPPDQLLAAPRSGAREGFQTLTVPMALCNALVLALAAERGEAALHMLERLGPLIASFED
ncbi:MULTISPECIES: MurR/RpiR family transcriptional regulator [unclassified Yoonia]|uniref:MurR/RpiR family transcriptional regulator n=1 Tax=unclassified Yoonia TaxID=2629118 RepID=UPI002AFE237C|nr:MULTISPECIES: MurR/RpiR family transcriptional regulator [unclassified Yoonia]